MAFNAEKGVITAPTSAGQQTYNLPNSFAPKALILWTTAETATDTTDADSILCVGFGTFNGGTVQQGYNSWWDDDAAAAAVVVRGKNTTAILKTFNADAAVIDMTVALVSLNDGSPATFVLDYTDPPTSAIKIHYLALGGSDLSAARVGSFSMTVTATQDVTVNAGFGQPDLMFFLGGGTTAVGDTANSAYMMLGAAASDTARQAAALTSTDASAAQTNGAWQKQRALLVMTTTSADAEADLSAKASWPTDGFQLTYADQTAGAGNVVIYLALKGTFQSSIGTGTAPTAGGLPVVDDKAVGFPGKTAIVWGTNRATSTAIDTTSADLGAFWLGATDGTNEGGAAITQDDAALNMVSKRRHNETKTIQFFTPATPTLESEADGSFSGNNFRLSWNDIDTVAREYNYLVIGDAAVVVSATPKPLVIVDPQSRLSAGKVIVTDAPSDVPTPTPLVIVDPRSRLSAGKVIVTDAPDDVATPKPLLVIDPQWRTTKTQIMVGKPAVEVLLDATPSPLVVVDPQSRLRAGQVMVGAAPAVLSIVDPLIIIDPQWRTTKTQIMVGAVALVEQTSVTPLPVIATSESRRSRGQILLSAAPAIIASVEPLVVRILERPRRLLRAIISATPFGAAVIFGPDAPLICYPTRVSGVNRTTDVRGSTRTTDTIGTLRLTDVRGTVRSTDIIGTVRTTDVRGTVRTTDIAGSRRTTDTEDAC